MVGAALLARLPCLKDWDNDVVLPDSRDVNSGNREVEKLCKRDPHGGRDL